MRREPTGSLLIGPGEDDYGRCRAHDEKLVKTFKEAIVKKLNDNETVTKRKKYKVPAYKKDFFLTIASRLDDASTQELINEAVGNLPQSSECDIQTGDTRIIVEAGEVEVWRLESECRLEVDDD